MQQEEGGRNEVQLCVVFAAEAGDDERFSQGKITAARGPPVLGPSALSGFNHRPLSPCAALFGEIWLSFNDFLVLTTTRF